MRISRKDWSVSAVVLSMFIAAELRACESAAAAPRPATKSSQREARASVKRVSETSFEISRTMMSAARARPAGELASEARLLAYREGGVLRGLELQGIRDGSDLVRAGFRNGDVVLAVDGERLTNAAKALEIYGRITSKEAFTVDVLRHGERQTFHYDVVP